MTAHRPDLDLIADIDAGLLDDPRFARVRAAALSDPAAGPMREALAATRAELGALPELPVPPEVAARWAAALDGATAAGGVAPPEPPRSTAPRGRPRRRRARGGLHIPRPALAAAVLLVVVLAVAGVLRARQEQPAVAGVELAATARSAIGIGDTGALADPARRSACLRAVAAPGLAPDAPLLGGRRITLDDRPGVLLVLGTGELGAFRVVVVNPECGPSGGVVLADTRIGR
jgi:hypothetical protein